MSTTKWKKLPCRKCGDTNLRIRWHKGGPYVGSMTVKKCSPYDASTREGEHLHVYCDTCQFDWISGDKT